LSNNTTDDLENLRTVYQEVCASYHGIADFRAKLLGFLPLASGVGIFLLLGELPGPEDPPLILFAVGLFGFLVTMGLFAYELRGIQRCNALIQAGSALEDKLELLGQFRLRPKPIGGFIGTTFASQIIYPTVFAAWAFVALFGILPSWIVIYMSSLIFAVGFVGSSKLPLKISFNELEKIDQEKRKDRM
jgi:hypothetical protein